MNRLFVEVGMLVVLLVRAQKKMEEHGRESLNHLREHMTCHEQTVCRDMGNRGNASEGSETRNTLLKTRGKDILVR